MPLFWAWLGGTGNRNWVAGGDVFAVAVASASGFGFALVHSLTRRLILYSFYLHSFLVVCSCVFENFLICSRSYIIVRVAVTLSLSLHSLVHTEAYISFCCSFLLVWCIIYERYAKASIILFCFGAVLSTVVAYYSQWEHYVCARSSFVHAKHILQLCIVRRFLPLSLFFHCCCCSFSFRCSC